MARRSLNKFAWMKALRGADLTHAEYRVVVNLSTWADADLSNAFPGLAALCVAARVSVPTARKALKSLAEKGWLVLVEPGGNQYFKGKANVYALTVPETAAGTSAPTAEGGRSVGSLDEPEGVDWFTPLAQSEGGDWNSQGGKPFSEGGNCVSGEGGKPVIPHQVVTPGHQIKGFHQGGGDVALGTARAGVHGAEIHPTEPVPDEPENSMAWIGRNLPGGFLDGEREQAQLMLDRDQHYASVRYAILRARHPPRRGLLSARRRADIIAAEPTGPAVRASDPDALASEGQDR